MNSETGMFIRKIQIRIDEEIIGLSNHSQLPYAQIVIGQIMALEHALEIIRETIKQYETFEKAGMNDGN